MEVSSSVNLTLKIGIFTSLHLWKILKEMGIPDHPTCLLFNLYAKYIMRNSGLEEAQAGIKIAKRNINNLRYAYDTTLMTESEEKLKKPLEESERGE